MTIEVVIGFNQNATNARNKSVYAINVSQYETCSKHDALIAKLISIPYVVLYTFIFKEG